MPQTKAAPTQKPKVAKPVNTKARLAEVTVVLGEAVKDTDKWNKCCLPLLGFLVFGIAIALVVIGATRDIEDLILIGAIFIVGSLIFFFLVYYNVCRPMCHRNQVSYDTFKQGEENPAFVPEPMPYYGSYNEEDDYLQAKNRPVPTDTQLYGGKRHRSFLATPATAADVTFDEDIHKTPPPPRVKSPLERMVSPPPKLSLPSGTRSGKRRPTFDMTINEEMKQRTKLETEDLELI